MFAKLPALISCLLLLALQPAMAKECVILIHGLAKSSGSMNTLEKHLKAQRYTVVNLDYPSTHFDIQTLAQNYIPQALFKCDSHSTIHFVTHSMGGILLRQYLTQHDIPRLGRVVMLAPPNQGSELVDKLYGVPGYRLIGDPASTQLGTRSEHLPPNLGEAHYELGIVAGNRSLNPILSRFIPQRDDGKVSVRNTRLRGMRAHLIAPTSHIFIMQHPLVIEQTLHFLDSGTFMARHDSHSTTGFSAIHTWWRRHFWQPYLQCEGMCV